MPRLVGALGMALLLMVALGSVQRVNADPIDPAFDELLHNNCPANCITVTMGTDPISGITTLEDIFYNNSNVTAGHGAIPTVTAGDEIIREFGGSKIGDVIRFENIPGVPAASAVAFIFSSDDGGLPADVGLPPSFQSNTQTITENASGFAGPFTPSTGQPGFSSAATVTYGLISADLPEPGTMALVAVGLAGLGLIRRRR